MEQIAAGAEEAAGASQEQLAATKRIFDGLRTARGETDALRRRTETVQIMLGDAGERITASARAIERNAQRQGETVEIIAELERRAGDIGEITQTVGRISDQTSLLALNAALAAARADGDDPWAHYALGCVHLLLRRFDNSLAEFELALNLNPNFALAQSVYGLALAFCGRWEDAHAATARAVRLSPRDPFSTMYYGIAAYANFVGRNYEEAMRLASVSIRLRGDHVGGHRGLTISAAMAGKPDIASCRLARIAARSAEFLPRVDCNQYAVQARCRP